MEDSVRDIGEKIIRDDLINADNIYVDLSFIKYISLGKLMGNTNMTAEMYNDIIKVVSSKEFEERNTDDVKIVFSSVPKIETVLTGSYLDNNIIFTMSPNFTGALEAVLDHISTVKSNKIVLGDKSPIVVHINMGNLILDEDFLTRLNEEYKNMLGVEVKLINKPIKDFTDDEILVFDSFFVSKFYEFTNKFIGILDERKLMDKNFFCTRRLPLGELSDIARLDLDVIFDSIEAVMAFATRFEYTDQPKCLM